MKSNFTETYESAANSAGQLVVKNIERMMELQIGSARVYAAVLLNNVREALEVKDAQSARCYLEKQPEVVRGIVQRMAKDSGEIIELGRAYADEAQTLFRKSATNIGAEVREDTKAAKKSA
tara:strand:+ start:184 stop:546 length:363 start_codon:yes stop_codon:yes gene_type:complete